MKYVIASAIAAFAVAGVAAAQVATAPVAAPAAVATPPSACPAYPAAPVLVGAEAIRNQKDLDAGTLKVNGYIEGYNAVHACRVAEIDALKIQYEARRVEAKSAQDATMAFSATWKATGEAVIARNASGNSGGQKTSRTGR